MCAKKRSQTDMNDNEEFGFNNGGMDNNRGGYGGNFHDRRSFNSYGKRPGPRNDFGFSKRSRIDNGDGNNDTGNGENAAHIMMTYKQFVNTIGDEGSEEELQQKYSEYKDKFKADSLNRFFQEHKDEEWFRQKYHPEESKEFKEKKKELVQHRFEVYQQYIVDRGLLDGVTLDVQNSDQIDKVFEAMVAKLEGLSDEDIDKYLNGETEEEGDENKEIMDEKEDDQEEKVEEKASKKRKSLVKYAGIFLRSVAPVITACEIDEICKKYESFVRVGLSDPMYDGKKLVKKGWVTLKEDPQVKNICWQLNTVRVGDSELSAILNKDVARIRTVNGMIAHNKIARNDLKQAAKLVTLYDRKMGLYFDESQTDEEIFTNLEFAIVNSKNPLLKDITDLLIEEGNLIDEVEESENGNNRSTLTRDEQLLQRLDKLIIYLRIVHSIDYYFATLFPIEDAMPSKCGVLHIRAEPMQQFRNAETGSYNIADSFIENHIKDFNAKLSNNVLHSGIVTEEEMIKLGKKDPDTEEENFINANCIELQPGKWLCELSGKKFKNADFVKKHLRTKHQAKIEEARAYADFYNNYISDPRRLQDPEQTGIQSDNDQRNFQNNPRFNRQNNWNDGGRRSYGGNRNFYNNGGNFNERQPRFSDVGEHMRRDPRQPVIYRDLDAPEDNF
ncbi:Serrate RNA effector molecule homolog [Strongyloides ratti]|uniref:Serrate RNA effector molecule homolog n=1 Tax=Strongyloides ratti TaxID=34506 RepID=A0A090MVZ3_STRRB|nr:Serrate RNA effector molecule homolog [Strongyloides ratti]CEF63243.1 Serrate RNA effector molecule homolog [Strongyloides ratti]